MKKSTEELMNILKEKKTYEEFFTEEVEEMYFCTISEFLNMLITEKNLKKSDIIQKSNLDKNYAYQIFNGTKTNPSRDKIVMLAFGMGLSLNETKKLIKIAQLKDLYIRDPRDSVIIFCINKGYNLMQTNEFLNDYGLECLE